MKNVINQGLETEEFFGFANDKEGDNYLGFVLGRNTVVTLDESALLIEQNHAIEYKKENDRAEILEKRTEADNYANRPKEESSNDEEITTTDPIDKAVVKRFHAAVELDPDSAALDFANISEEVLQHFTSKLEMKVKISVEIEVETNGEMDEALQRTVKENASTLKFKHAEFEKD